MAELPLLTADCVRCGYPEVTLDVRGIAVIGSDVYGACEYELQCRCRKCYKTSIMVATRSQSPGVVVEKYAGHYINTGYYIKRLPLVIPLAMACPDFVPDQIKSVFDEAAKCLMTDCFDASGTMFRKTVDVATRTLLPPQPDPEDQAHPHFIAWKRRKDLKLRLDLLFERKLLPDSLKELASCIHEDGNDAAHASVGIGEAEANDLQDFTVGICWRRSTHRLGG